MVNPNKLAFERRYSDGSGIEYAIRLDSNSIADNAEKGEIEFEHINKCKFPLSEIDWIIECLQKIKDEVKPKMSSSQLNKTKEEKQDKQN